MAILRCRKCNRVLGSLMDSVQEATMMIQCPNCKVVYKLIIRKLGGE